MAKASTTSSPELVFATNNQHKLDEIRQILDGQIHILSLADIGCHVDIPETADTLQGNALQKARYVASHYNMDCFADDTGLEVAALDGAPGVHSARYAGGQGHDSQANMDLLLHNMEKKSDRKARFRTVIALIIKGEEHLFEGIVNGKILTERHGTDGFGYDPVFQPDGFDCTFAEMTASQKNAISHRGRATQKLVQFLTSLT
ncbi:MAG: non-canonical purine NTP diphosphatase [Bacteroidaceae bacterium]|nr:non-canonical purine NTP diphosphatase [Bacteroidaceae bacterium]